MKIAIVAFIVIVLIIAWKMGGYHHFHAGDESQCKVPNMLDGFCSYCEHMKKTPDEIREELLKENFSCKLPAVPEFGNTMFTKGAPATADLTNSYGGETKLIPNWRTITNNKNKQAMNLSPGCSKLYNSNTICPGSRCGGECCACSCDPLHNCYPAYAHSYMCNCVYYCPCKLNKP